MIQGPGIVSGKTLTAPINTFDTAATITKLFSLKQPAGWIGKPVDAAFAK